MSGSVQRIDSPQADSRYGEAPGGSEFDAGSVFGTVTALRLIVADLERLAGDADAAELRDILLVSSAGIRAQQERLAAIPWSRLRCRAKTSGGPGQGGESWPV